MESKTLWKDTKRAFILFLIVGICAYCLHRCYNSEPNTTVVIPEQKGQTVIYLPKNIPIKGDTKIKWFENKRQNDFLQSEIDKLLNENQILKNEYANSTDSLRSLLYNQAIQLNSFHETIDNDTIKIDAKGITQGKLKTLKIDWKIKSKTIEVKQKRTVFLLKTGLEYGSLNLNKGVIKANLDFNNLKIGYDTDQRIWIGYNFKIFEIKR